MLFFTQASGPGVKIAVNPYKIQSVEPHGDGCLLKVGGEKILLLESLDFVVDAIRGRLST
jgi:uncharacterized protein YlzI (FlbEa/FlbD family)